MVKIIYTIGLFDVQFNALINVLPEKYNRTEI